MEGRGRCRGRGAALLAAFEAQKRRFNLNVCHIQFYLSLQHTSIFFCRPEKSDDGTLPIAVSDTPVGTTHVSDPTLKSMGRAQGLLKMVSLAQRY